MFCTNPVLGFCRQGVLPTGFGVKRSFSSLWTQTTASTRPDSSISMAMDVTMPVHCAACRR